jgi:predicted transcriptional regulator
MTTPAIAIRLESELLERIDRLASTMQERAAGAEVTRTAAMKVALTRGLDALEAELGVAGRRAKPKK